jgi:two-component system sensor histidine kinase/response regulator
MGLSVRAPVHFVATPDLAEAVDQLDAGLLLLDSELRVVSHNPRFREMFGAPAAVCEPGTHIRDLLHAAVEADPARYAQVLEGRSEEQFVNERIEALLVLGEPFVQRIGDSWLRTTDRRTAKGGIVSLSLDVTWHVETEAQLRQTAVAAEAAARAKADFLATMSHEIRTPMNGVIGMANLLVKTRLDPQQREFAETIRSCGESLLVLINDVLDFSKMEAGKLELENVSFPLHNLVEDVVLLFAEEAEKKKLRIGYSFAPNLPIRVDGDPTRVRQILLNLVSNAVKFTHQGYVDVRVLVIRREGSKLRLAFDITDSGIGMTSEQVSNLGQAFSQGDVSMTRRYGGTGLGLSICSRLARMMQGRVAVSSVPGHGTTFRLELELNVSVETTEAPEQGLFGKRVAVVVADQTDAQHWAELCSVWGMEATICRDASEFISQLKQRAERPDLALIDFELPGIDGLMLARVVRADQRFGALPMLLVAGHDKPPLEELQQLGISGLLERPMRPSQLLEAVHRVFRPDLAPSERRNSISPMRRVSKVLVAEDNPINRRLVMLLLRELAEQVDFVDTGLEAVKRYEETAYDCVLMDCQMPEMDGYEATRRIRAIEEEQRRPRTPIVAMTANALAGDREACLDAGMDEYLSKPLRADDLANVLGGIALRTTVLISERAEPPRAQSWLERLREALGPEVAGEILMMGYPTLSELLDEGRRAAKSDDWVKVGRVAHAANGAAGTLCLDELRENCVRLEIVARAKDAQQLPDAMAAWTDSMYQVLDWLSAAANADQLTPISTLP